MSNGDTCNCLFLLGSTFSTACLKPGLPWLLGLPIAISRTVIIWERICLLSSGKTTYKPSLQLKTAVAVFGRRVAAKETVELPVVHGRCFMIAFPEAGGLKSWGFPLCCWLPDNLSSSSVQACLSPSSSFFRWFEQRTHQSCWRVSHQQNTSSQVI